MSGPLIDHDPEEPKKPYRPVPWWVIGGMAVVFWVGLFASGEFNWYSVAVAGFSGLMLATWAIEITGNKTPASWKSKSASGNRNADL